MLFKKLPLFQVMQMTSQLQKIKNKLFLNCILNVMKHSYLTKHLQMHAINLKPKFLSIVIQYNSATQHTPLQLQQHLQQMKVVNSGKEKLILYVKLKRMCIGIMSYVMLNYKPKNKIYNLLPKLQNKVARMLQLLNNNTNQL